MGASSKVVVFDDLLCNWEVQIRFEELLVQEICKD